MKESRFSKYIIVLVWNFKRKFQPLKVAARGGLLVMVITWCITGTFANILYAASTKCGESEECLSEGDVSLETMTEESEFVYNISEEEWELLEAVVFIDDGAEYYEVIEQIEEEGGQ